MSGELLLSVDFEDWHQLVRRRVGAENWREPGPALERQTDAMLGLFDELGVHCTFFVLGMAARAHPHLIERIISKDHEIACHGDQHLPVFTQSRAEFEADLEAATSTIEDLTGRRPVGYRAPAFSITRRTPWAHGVLADHGFQYDASEHDTPVVRDRARSSETGARRLRDADLWELPVAATRWRTLSLPVGGASYWAVTPTALILDGLARAPQHAGLYLHPHELDPEPLRALLERRQSVPQRSKASLRTLQRNAARRRATDVLRAIATRHPLITYGEAHARLSTDGRAGS